MTIGICFSGCLVSGAPTLHPVPVSLVEESLVRLSEPREMGESGSLFATMSITSCERAMSTCLGLRLLKPGSYAPPKRGNFGSHAGEGSISFSKGSKFCWKTWTFGVEDFTDRVLPAAV
jgi:hypothetical protein